LGSQGVVLHVGGISLVNGRVWSIGKPGRDHHNHGEYCCPKQGITAAHGSGRRPAREHITKIRIEKGTLFRHGDRFTEPRQGVREVRNLPLINCCVKVISDGLLK